MYLKKTYSYEDDIQRLLKLRLSETMSSPNKTLEIFPSQENIIMRS